MKHKSIAKSLLFFIVAIMIFSFCGCNATEYESMAAKSGIRLFSTTSTTYFKDIGDIQGLYLDKITHDGDNYVAAGRVVYRYKLTVNESSDVDQLIADRKKAIVDRVETLNRTELDTDDDKKYDEGFRILQIKESRYYSEKTAQNVVGHFIETILTFENLSHVNANYRIYSLENYVKVSGVKEYLNYFTDAATGKTTSIVAINDKANKMVLRIDPTTSSDYVKPVPIYFQNQRIIAVHGENVKSKDILVNGNSVEFLGTRGTDDVLTATVSEAAVLFAPMTFWVRLSTDLSWIIYTVAAVIVLG